MHVLSVSAFLEGVNGILKELYANDAIAVEGEVSGFRVSQGQWVTFDLKDDKALINIFMTVWNLRVPVEDGLKVRVFGTPRVYPKYGKFSITAERIELAGEGALRKALALLRTRLEAEGLFEMSRKRTLPRFPSKIAIIASRDSAAYGDFIRILNERWRGLDVHLYHALVQGERAPESLVTAIRAAQSGSYDALVMTRGGGSLEELMAFNDERVVRAIHASKIPTLVGIGHERDITLAEEAADVRASTPTDCARRLVPDRQDILYELSAMTERLEQRLRHQLSVGDRLLTRALQAPAMWVARTGERTRNLESQAVRAVDLWMRHLQDRLALSQVVIEQVNPEKILSRGYALVREVDGRVVTSALRVRTGSSVRIQWKDGEKRATMEGESKQVTLW